MSGLILLAREKDDGLGMDYSQMGVISWRASQY